MIIDTHAHAWPRWPYDPSVPDSATRGSAEQLVYELKVNNVASALIVVAHIEENPDNNEYVAGAQRRFPKQILPLIDLESFWFDHHATPGAPERVEKVIRAFPEAMGTSHYVGPNPASAEWLLSNEGDAVFSLVEERFKAISVSSPTSARKAVCELARRHPRLTFILPHLGGVQGSGVELDEGMTELAACATVPNIWIKLSGFNYGSTRGTWDFPYEDRLLLAREIYRLFGSSRVCWGSNSPVSQGRGWLTYTQSLEVVRSHCDFIPSSELDGVLGDNIADLLGLARGVDATGNS